jgi:hypothetical protein
MLVSNVVRLSQIVTSIAEYLRSKSIRSRQPGVRAGIS